MTAKNQDFQMNVGESKQIDVSETIDDETGNQVDFTGFNELTWVFKAAEGEDPIITKKESQSADVRVTDATVGAYEIDIRPADTEGLSIVRSRDYFHIVRLEDGSGRIADLLEGHITVEEV